MTLKKILTFVLLGLGLLMILAGLILIFQMGASHTGGAGGLSRASTSIKFGADFYTTSAQATGLAANAVIDVYKLISFVSGFFFIMAGCVDVCLTLIKSDILEMLKKKQPVPPAAPAYPPIKEPEP